jgi:hypothetical protein
MTMPEGVLIADRGAASGCPTMHSTPALSSHRRRLAWLPTPRPGSAGCSVPWAPPAERPSIARLRRHQFPACIAAELGPRDPATTSTFALCGLRDSRKEGSDCQNLIKPLSSNCIQEGQRRGRHCTEHRQSSTLTLRQRGNKLALRRPLCKNAARRWKPAGSAAR